MEKQIDSIEIGMIAACIADNFLKQLYEISGSGYIACLDHISAWAHEFYHAYYEKMKNWETFEESADNIYKSICWDDFLIDWGKDRLTTFLANK